VFKEDKMLEQKFLTATGGNRWFLEKVM
jgi:hypothetical protein